MRRGKKGGNAWTAAAVAEAVIEAFRVLPSMPVYSPRPAEFVPLDPRQDREPLHIVALTERVLGRATPERKALLIWARMKAAKRIRADRHQRHLHAVPGSSITEHCIAFGLNRRTFDRHRVRACIRVAAEMNRIGDEALSALENLRATSPPLAERIDRLG